MYNEIIPTLELIEKMLKNEEDKSTLVRFVDSTFPNVKMSVLASDIKNCTSCGLFACNHIVFDGNLRSDIMIIGDAPGEQEDKAGKPFIGSSSNILNNMLRTAADKIDPRWNKENLFLTYMIKCKPVNNYGSLRQPELSEISLCKKFIDREIKIVNPKLIICLGGLVAKTLIHPQFDLTQEHGKLFGDREQRLMALYSPSYVMMLGENTPEGIQRKKEMWQDLISANEYLSSI